MKVNHITPSNVEYINYGSHPIYHYVSRAVNLASTLSSIESVSKYLSSPNKETQALAASVMNTLISRAAKLIIKSNDTTLTGLVC